MIHMISLEDTHMVTTCTILRVHHCNIDTNKQGTLTKELERFSGVMNRMFPLFDPASDAVNLTEIPTPQKTLQQRFLTISESEPFGPVEASKIFDLEPAQKTLDSLSEVKHKGDDEVEMSTVLVGEQRAGDKTQFRFTMAKAGEVGFRYGASRRDRKKDRAVGFNRGGKMVYT